eukprot:m.823749 g.823749  ORF g.823749 m.823749 type:complete len:619 (-) comp23404_c0_seq1:2097-3953(-)
MLSSVALTVALSANLALGAFIPAPRQTYWWMFHNEDCGYDDVPGSCQGKTVAECETMCLNTKGCGGFNYPHGVLKKTDCLSNKAASTVDLYILESTPQPPPPPPPSNFPPVWPLMSQYTNGTATVSVASTLKYVDDSATATKTIAQAFTRYQGLTFPHHASAAAEAALGAAISELHVSIKDTDESHPQLGVDESYTLDINSDGSNVLVTANTIYGAMHALETFSQLVSFDFANEVYVIKAAPWKISDAPRFPHRGLMVDTARHFQPLESLRIMIDSLPYAKINVLHWHMVDSQSFPMESKTHPKLWNGAYSEVEKYTQDDIASIVEYARLRGVRVMVEFDMPGHAASWCVGYPEICPSTSCTQPLNVANNATFDLITALLGEMTGGKSSAPSLPSGLFPSNMIHLGGDEVNTDCWSKTPAVQAWLTKMGFTADQGYAYFVKRAADIAIAQGRRPVQWVEVFDHFGSNLTKETIVHVWKDKSTLNAVVAAGYNALINNSPGDNSWYLDHLNIAWAALYGNEPCETISDPKQCGLILGGQGEMWGETVDGSDIQSTVWPRLGAIAERLWSPRDAINDTSAALVRMESFRCRLNRRGVAAAPVNNANARSAPPGAGGCLTQ